MWDKKKKKKKMIYIEEMHWPVSQQQSPERPYVLKNTSDDDRVISMVEKSRFFYIINI